MSHNINPSAGDVGQVNEEGGDDRQRGLQKECQAKRWGQLILGVVERGLGPGGANM